MQSLCYIQILTEECCVNNRGVFWIRAENELLHYAEYRMSSICAVELVKNQNEKFHAFQNVSCDV